MRVMMAVGIVLGLCGSAGAMTEAECLRAYPTIGTPAWCQQVAAKDAALASAVNQERQADQQGPSDPARQQALGLALFGSGPALIQGMNQGFRPLPPYQQPGAQK